MRSALLMVAFLAAKPVRRSASGEPLGEPNPTTTHEHQQTSTDTLTASLKTSANLHERLRALVSLWHGRGQEFNSPKLHSFECGTAPAVPHLRFWGARSERIIG